MPKMGGVEVCRTIRAEPELRNMKVMVITGFCESPEVKEVARLGFTHIYNKPSNLQDFREVVNHFLKGHSV